MLTFSLLCFSFQARKIPNWNLLMVVLPIHTISFKYMHAFTALAYRRKTWTSFGHLKKSKHIVKHTDIHKKHKNTLKTIRRACHIIMLFLRWGLSPSIIWLGALVRKIAIAYHWCLQSVTRDRRRLYSNAHLFILKMYWMAGVKNRWI